MYSLRRQEDSLGEKMPITIVLLNPKYEINVANTKRAAAAFGADAVLVIGKRYKPATGEKGDRKPRPLRMKVYDHIEIRDLETLPSIYFDSNNLVVVEKLEWATPLPNFVHPENAAYIFGPEDGSVPKWIREKAKFHTFIPTNECLNLASAVNVVLYDRNTKENR